MRTWDDALWDFLERRSTLVAFTLETALTFVAYLVIGIIGFLTLVLFT